MRRYPTNPKKVKAQLRAMEKFYGVPMDPARPEQHRGVTEADGCAADGHAATEEACGVPKCKGHRRDGKPT